MSKIEQGNAHIRQAEKSLKTSFLKWRPDYEVAADEYTHAATCFRIARSYQQCKDCLMKASHYFKENRSLFHAAKSIEQAVIICKEMGKLTEIPKLAHNSCTLYEQHGSPESGATVLDKAAKIVMASQPEEALDLCKRAASIVMGEDSPRQAAEYMSKVARLQVKLQMYDQAAESVRSEIGMHQQIDHQPSIGRLTVALVLVHLARGDQVAATKAFNEWGNYCDVPEVETLEALLKAIDNEDADAARQALNSPFIKHMDVEYAKLARSLPLPQQVYAVQPVSVRPDAAEPYVSPNAAKLSAQSTLESEEPPAAEGPDYAAQGLTEDEEQAEELPSSAPKPAPLSAPAPPPAKSAPKEEGEDDYEGGLC